MSKRYTLNKADLYSIVKVMFYAGGSGAVVALVGLLPDIDIPAMFIWAVPMVNIGLVAIKKLFANKLEEVKEG